MVYEGCVRALGIQMKATLVSIFCFWGVSIPLAYIFAFTELDLSIMGLWLSMFIGENLQFVILVFIISRADWQSYAVKAQKRMQEEKEEVLKTRKAT